MRPLVQKTPAKANENFENAVQPYLNDLKNYCRSLMKSRWDGEDLMQETLTKAYKSWVNAPRPISKAYLFRIASNTWIDSYRKRKPDEDLNQDLSALVADKETNSSVMIEAMEILLHELSPKQRIAVLLMEGYEYTAQETAKLIGTSEGAVKAALHRARRKLKKVEKTGGFYAEEDDRSITYVTAFRNGNPGNIVKLFQEEMQQPQMSGATSRPDFGQQISIQQIAGTGASYVLVGIPMRNGDLLFIPFYRSEWLTLLSILTEKFSFAA